MLCVIRAGISSLVQEYSPSCNAEDHVLEAGEGGARSNSQRAIHARPGGNYVFLDFFAGHVLSVSVVSLLL